MQTVEDNQFNGMWNVQFFDGETVETAIYDLLPTLRMAVG
jgi:hypothetical protein